MKIFDIYSGLLRYPSDMSDFSYGIDMLGRQEMSHLKSCELGILQEEYVESFDFSEKSALSVTGHVSAEEKERINVLAGFAAFRSRYGVSESTAPPDYLPDLLNAMQTASDSETERVDAVLMSGILLRGVEKIEKALYMSGSLYRPVITGLKDELCRLAEHTEVSDA